MTPDQDLVERLTRLEAAHRRLRSTVSVLIVALAAVPLVLSLRSVGTIVADGLIIRDSKGHVGVSIGTLEEHSFLSVYGPDETEVQLLATKRGPVLTLAAGGGVKGMFGGDSRDAYLRLQIGGKMVELAPNSEPGSASASP